MKYQQLLTDHNFSGTSCVSLSLGSFEARFKLLSPSSGYFWEPLQCNKAHFVLQNHDYQEVLDFTMSRVCQHRNTGL